MTLYDQASARVGTTALYLGDDPFNPSDWDAIRDAMLEQHELVGKYWVDYQTGMDMFVNEEVVVRQFTAGRTRMGAAAGGAIDWTVSEEGCLVFDDTFAVPKTAQNPENGHAFINFLHEPEIMAMQMEVMYYDTLNEAAHNQLDEGFRAQFAVPEDAHLVLANDLAPEI